MNPIDYEALVDAHQEDEHVTGLPKEKLINLTVDKTYKYRMNPVEKLFSILLTMVALLVWPFLLFYKHGFLVKGRRNLKALKHSGAISIANHVLSLDGVMVAQALFPKRVMFHTLEDNMKIPFTRHFIRLLGGIPIPNNLTARASYIKATNQFIAEGKIIQIYPEASLWPNYNKIRNFKTGAFHFAVKNNVPIVPICLNFRRPRGIVKYLPMKDDLVTVHIGKPIYPNQELPFKESVDDLLKRSHHNMVRMNRFFKWLDHQHELKEEQTKEELL